MKRNTKIILLILSILSLAAHLVLLGYMPDLVPVRWNAAGEAAGYSSRYITLIFALLPLFVLGLFLLIPRLARSGEEEESYQSHGKVYGISCTLIVIFLIALDWIINAAIFGLPVDLMRFVCAGVAVLLIVLGHYIPEVPQNNTFGIRTPWALRSKNVWEKTNEAGGRVFSFCGILFIIAAVFARSWIIYVTLAVLVIGVIGIYMYSWNLYQEEPKKKPGSKNTRAAKKHKKKSRR